jgi:hypothetical protein
MFDLRLMFAVNQATVQDKFDESKSANLDQFQTFYFAFFNYFF